MNHPLQTKCGGTAADTQRRWARDLKSCLTAALLATCAVTQADPITPETTITGNCDRIGSPGMLGFSSGAAVLQLAGGLRLNSPGDCKLTQTISMPWSTPVGGSVAFYELRTGSGSTNIHSDGTPYWSVTARLRDADSGAPVAEHTRMGQVQAQQVASNLPPTPRYVADGNIGGSSISGAQSIAADDYVFELVFEFGMSGLPNADIALLGTWGKAGLTGLWEFAGGVRLDAELRFIPSTAQNSDVPEPATAALALLGGSLAWVARRRRRGT